VALLVRERDTNLRQRRARWERETQSTLEMGRRLGGCWLVSMCTHSRRARCVRRVPVGGGACSLILEGQIEVTTCTHMHACEISWPLALSSPPRHAVRARGLHPLRRVCNLHIRAHTHVSPLTLSERVPRTSSTHLSVDNRLYPKTTRNRCRAACDVLTSRTRWVWVCERFETSP
jgi:hypothetical protein